jgi:hypothetical protein
LGFTAFAQLRLPQVAEAFTQVVAPRAGQAGERLG